MVVENPEASRGSPSHLAAKDTLRWTNITIIYNYVFLNVDIHFFQKVACHAVAMFVYRTEGYWSTDFSTIRLQSSCSLPIFATVARETLRRVRTTTLGSKVLTRFIARHSWSMQRRNNQNRKQIRAIFEHVKDFANCYSPVLKLTIANNMYLSYLPVYFQAAAFSGTSIKDHGNSQSGNNIQRESTAEQREGWQVPVLCKNGQFSSFWHEMCSHDFTHSLSPQLLLACFFSLESTMCSSWFFVRSFHLRY